MIDTLYIVIFAAFFAATIGFVKACECLAPRETGGKP